MRPPTARVLAASALALAMVALGCLAAGAGAMVVTTCRATADSDARVDYDFCVLELGHYRESPDADTWGLAKVAALTGIINADNAIYDAKALLAKPGTGGPTRAALEQCAKLYDSMGYAFADAYDEINNRRYGAGKEKAAEAAPLAHQCDDALANAGAVPSPLAKYSPYSVQIAVICMAITNLIK